MNTMSRMGTSVVRSHPITGVASTLRKTTPGIIVRRHDDGPGSHGAGFGVHNVDAIGSGDPLFIVSKLMTSNNDFSGLGPGSVRGVSVLGSTNATTVCNSHSSGNMILIAAGGNGGGRHTAIQLDNVVK